MKLLLFDIDGTLLSTNGAATKSAEKAFEKIYNINNIMSGIMADGRTDPLILKEMFNKGLNRDYTDQEAESVFKEYINFLNIELSKGGNLTLMPGIYSLLSILSAKYDILLGVATGNIEQGAWIKLKHGGLDKFFDFGGFGSDSHCREQLIRKAIERAFDYCNDKMSAVYVIGDTPFDIIHGKAAGALTVAVSTGNYSYEELIEYKPDYLFHSFKNSLDFLNVL